MALVAMLPVEAMHFDFRREQMDAAFKSMGELWKDNCLCDVVIKVKGRRISAHKLILASSVPYFHAMFTSGLKEMEETEITLNEMDPDAVNTIIEFAYTACLSVNEHNVQSLLPVACILQLTPVIKACCDFLKTQLDAANCLGICTFAEIHECHALSEEARKYCNRYFTRVVNHEEFLQLHVDKLVEYLSCDELCVRSETEVFLAAMKWIKYDEEIRGAYSFKVLSAIRLNLLPDTFVQGFLQRDLVSRNFSVVWQNALSTLLQDSSKSMVQDVRCPVGSLVIFSAGGYLKHSLGSLECFDAVSITWTTHAPMSEPKSGSGAAFLGGSFYVIGGRNNSIQGNIDLDSAECYDPFANQWKQIAKLSVPRNRVGVGVLASKVYAVGGSDGMIHLDSAECYDPERDCWTSIAPMKTRRIGVGVAAINDMMYAVGGFDGENRLRSVECFCPTTNTWKFVASTNTPRSGAGVAAVGSYLYAVGGYNGIAQLNSAERYDPSRDEWTLVSPMLYRRSALNVAVLRDKLYAMGGYDGECFLSSIEVYDPKEDTWSFVSDMMVGRSGAAVAVGTKPLS